MKFQMFHSSRIKYLILVLLSFSFIQNVSAVVKPTNLFYVNDYANILSDETEKYILNKSISLNNIDGTQIVVVTVPNLEGMSLEQYSLQLFRDFGIGDKEKNNGLLLLLALEEREFRVEVGYGLEGILPDGKTGRFQDEYIIPYLKNNNWDEGIKNGYDAFYKEIVTLNNLDLSYNEPTYKNSKVINPFSYIIAVIMGIEIASIIKIFDKNKVRKFMIIYFLLLLFPMLIFNSLALLVHFLTVLIYNPTTYSKKPFGSFYKGGFGGSSFGGSSFGGGSSGGGGRSGGGGSSRKF